MKSNLYVLVLLLLSLSLCKPVSAQFSMYGSATYGYNQNPLGNYQQLSDQMKQTYLEMNYLKGFKQSTLGFSYVSSLVLFNEFGDRSYYEHNFFTRYNIKFPKKASAAALKENKEETEVAEVTNSEVNSDAGNAEQSEEETVSKAEDEDESSVDEEVQTDSTDKYLDFMLKAGARHDKEAFKEFDNVGTEFVAAYKFMLLDNFSLRISNNIGYRNYPNIAELSNITDQFSLQIANKYNGSYSYGARLFASVKYYTSTMYDTARFEQKKTTTKKPGKGKGGASIEVASGKQILIQPQANGTVQYAAGLFYIKTWEAVTLETNFLYSFSPKISARYLAQQVNTTSLSEDLYNDFFSYEGPSFNIKFNCPLFFSIQLSSEVQSGIKNFEAPALTIDGEQTSLHREDIHTSLEVFFSRPLSLIKGLSTDLVLGVGILRNQSNDDYNDFSAFSVSGGIGIGL